MKKDYIKKWEESRGSGGTIDDLYNNLHLQRRFVSHFYHQKADLHMNKVIPRKVLFRVWTKGDLSIIPEIIIPLENAIK